MKHQKHNRDQAEMGTAHSPTQQKGGRDLASSGGVGEPDLTKPHIVSRIYDRPHWWQLAAWAEHQDRVLEATCNLERHGWEILEVRRDGNDTVIIASTAW